MTWAATRAKADALRNLVREVTGQRFCTHGQHWADKEGGVMKRGRGTGRWICAECVKRRG